jgi:hypothetical protein
MILMILMILMVLIISTELILLIQSKHYLLYIYIILELAK